MPNIVDRYIQASDDPATSLAAPPPWAPPQSNGDKTVLQLHVPAENTSLEMGAGQIPGIRMESDHHAHISALSPLTTISLGWAGGKGPLGSPGLSIVTDGDKTEVIKGITVETYQGAATVTYHSNVEEHCDASKVERVTGNRSEHTVGGRLDTVNGDWMQTCGQWKTETVTGGVTLDYKSLASTIHQDAFESYGASRTVNIASPKNEFVGGTYTQTLLGGLQSTVAGPWFLHHFDTKVDLCAAIQFTGTMGLRMALNESLDINHSLANFSKTSFDLAKSDSKLGRSLNSIYDAITHIFK
jgi:hypothetical protein